MKTFSTTVAIQASPEEVWSILTDAAAWPAWNPTVDKVEGTIALRETVKVHAKISPGRAFPVEVVALDPPRTMVWSSGMPLGLFKGERTFRLTPRDGGGVEFAMRETFTGLLAPLIGRTIPDLQPTFDEFARALKERAEAR